MKQESQSKMIEPKNNNLEIFRNQLKYFLINSDQYQPADELNGLHIKSYEQFLKLINHLCNQKLLQSDQQKKLKAKIQPLHLNNVVPKMITQLKQSGKDSISPQQVLNKKKIVSFPLSINQFENIIMTQFGDENCKNLMNDLQKFKTLLKQVKGVLNVWKDKGLTNQQKSELEAIFAKGNQKINNLCQELKKKKQILQNISEQQIQMIKSLDEWVIMQKVTEKFLNYKDFQKQNQQVINSLYNKNLVKQAHFKKKQSKLIQQISKVRGFNSKNDQPIQVVLIAKNSINFSAINKQLIKFDALKQLSMSEYYPKFYGFNTHSSPTYIQYYIETFQTKNLNFLMKSQKALDLTSPLLKYWMYQIYKSFYDIFLMCSYEPGLPIKIQDFEVKDCGLQLVLKNINFLQKRQTPNFDSNKIDNLQTNLLHNLGLIFLNLLSINPTLDQINRKLPKLQQKCFFKSLLNVVESHKNYQNQIVENKLSFFNLQTHPLLQQLQFSDGVQIIQNYIAIFGNQ